ncbi:nucleoporin Nup35-like [Leguminivora glycinivorella]|uniref:nucleoporin Nup35-like n=1 Tax=Leguminivora glycinivorella TaxID=1035111 RepID=UPI00201032B9|nr:nucleoporin Nup35-like [Leguminivora glycinivorella]
MEPMTLGSPTHSPSGSPNVGYLPPFLLGEINPPTTPRTNSLSPTKGRNLAFGSPTSPTQTSTPDQKHFRQNLSMHQQALYNQQNMFANAPTSPNASYNPNMSYNPPNMSYNNSKTTGPPIEDLFDTIKSNEPSVNKSLFQEQSFYNNSVLQNSYMNNMNGSSMNPAAWDGSQEQEEYWVTVFGFPPNAANTVLARFSNCGAILDKQYPTQGNWAHVRYATRAEKERAMSLSGRQVLPGVMVGVAECREPPRQPTSPQVARQTQGARSLCPTPVPSAPVPQRSNGLISKALDYVLGW